MYKQYIQLFFIFYQCYTGTHYLCVCYCSRLLNYINQITDVETIFHSGAGSKTG